MRLLLFLILLGLFFGVPCAGSVVGGGWASGCPALEILQKTIELHGTGAGEVNIFRFALRLLMSLRPFRKPLPDGIVDGGSFLDKIKSGLRVDRIEETPIPFRCIACKDDGTFARKVFRKGPLLPAIYSSMSIPGVVIPRPGDDAGNTYYDGGIVEKTPLKSVISDHARMGSGRRLVLICTHFGNEAAQMPQKGFLRRLLGTISALEDQLWDYQLAEARAREDVTVVLLNPKLHERGMFNFERAERMYLAAREVSSQQLGSAQIGQSLGLV